MTTDKAIAVPGLAAPQLEHHRSHSALAIVFIAPLAGLGHRVLDRPQVVVNRPLAPRGDFPSDSRLVRGLNRERLLLRRFRQPDGEGFFEPAVTGLPRHVTNRCAIGPPSSQQDRATNVVPVDASSHG